MNEDVLPPKSQVVFDPQISVQPEYMDLKSQKTTGQTDISWDQDGHWGCNAEELLHEKYISWSETQIQSLTLEGLDSLSNISKKKKNGGKITCKHVTYIKLNYEIKQHWW